MRIEDCGIVVDVSKIPKGNRDPRLNYDALFERVAALPSGQALKFPAAALEMLKLKAPSHSIYARARRLKLPIRVMQRGADVFLLRVEAEEQRQSVESNGDSEAHV